MTLQVATDEAATPSVLWKAFDVLDAFQQHQRVLTLSQIARRTGLPKSTVHRILAMLLEVGALDHTPEGYKIGLRMFSMGSLSLDARLRDIALPHLERLRRLTRQTVHIATLQGTDVVYLDKLPSRLSPNTPALIGGRLPAHRTGVGMALLAFREGPVVGEPARPGVELPVHPEALRRDLETVRRSGVASDREQAAPGLACMAAPIMVGDRAVAAVSVAFNASDGSGQAFVNPLKETVGALARATAAAPDLTL